MCEDCTVDSLAKERDLLLQRSARLIGLCFGALSLAIFLVPGVVEPTRLTAIIPLLLVMFVCLFFMGSSRNLLLVVAGMTAGIGTLFAASFPLGEPQTADPLSAMAPLAAAAIGAFSIVLTDSAWRVVVLCAGFAATAVAIALVGNDDVVVRAWFGIAAGWAILIIFSRWLCASIPPAARSIYSIGRAHRAERRASETEAQRRQSARLLHDTVLATLTLLAHSGVGVAPEAMRQQADDDARLLRQLRLGTVPAPSASGDYNLEPVEETALGTTLESVKHRFGRMGLEVSWHGTGQVLLPSEVLDAFLLALAECLENVRRHSGVTGAHVTITEDETMVRAMVTDSGVGFDIKNVDEARLGLKDSVIGRLKEVGGSARLFSAAGAGTTVVLEVPRS